MNFRQRICHQKTKALSTLQFLCYTGILMFGCGLAWRVTSASLLSTSFPKPFVGLMCISAKNKGCQFSNCCVFALTTTGCMPDNVSVLLEVWAGFGDREKDALAVYLLLGPHFQNLCKIRPGTIVSSIFLESHVETGTNRQPAHCSPLSLFSAPRLCQLSTGGLYLATVVKHRSHCAGLTTQTKMCSATFN